MNTPVIRSVYVHCEVEHAFDVFTTQLDVWWPPGHRRFENSTLSLEAREGGQFVERSNDGNEVLLGNVLRCERPHSIAYTWYPGAVNEPTLVEISFTPEKNGTLVEVVHSEGSSELGDLWSKRAAIFSKSWDEVLPAYAAGIDRDTSE